MGLFCGYPYIRGMKKLLLAGLLLSAASVQAQRRTLSAAQLAGEEPSDLGHPHIIEVALDTPGVSVGYAAKASRVAYYKERAKRRRRHYRASDHGPLPRGGYISVSWIRLTAKEAEPPNFTLVLTTPTGRQLLRSRGVFYDEPSFPGRVSVTQSSNSRAYYSSGMEVQIPHPMGDGTHISILDSLANRQYQFKFKK